MKTKVSSRAKKLGALSLLLLAATAGAAHSLLPGKTAPHAGASSANEAADAKAAHANGGAKSSRFDRARAPGLRRTYDLRFDEDIALKSGTANANANVRIRVSGALDLAFVGHVDGKHRLFAQLADVHLTFGNGGPSAKTAAVERELAQPFWVLAETDGRVRGYSFPRELSPTAQNLLRGILGSAQIAVRDEAQWTADEDDIQGSYVASYSKDDAGAFVKTKRPYAKVEGMSTLDVRARGTATVGNDGWPRDIAFEEHKVASMGEGMPVATTDAHLTMKVVGTRADASLLGRYERESEGLVDAGPFGSTDDAESARIADRRLVGDATADAILGDVRAATDDASMIAAGDKLAARLRLAPADSDRMATLAKTLPAREANVVVGALGGAGTRESTKALGNLVNDHQGPAAIRANAATQLAFASGANADAARDALAQGAADPSREVREASTLALGNVARELGDSDGDTVHDLIARYERARDDEERALVLQALGNTGSVEILPTVRAALASENESLREAAAQALRFLPLGEADTVLSRVLGSEPSPTVLVAAIDSIGFRVVEMHARALEPVVVADGSGRVRAAVAEIAQRALSSRKATLTNEARAVLTALLEKARGATNG